MKLFKSLAIATLSSLLFMTANLHATEKNVVKTQKKDVALERFNQNVGLKFVQRGIRVTEDNQPQVVLKYIVENKGKSKIKSMHWISAYVLNEKVIYTQDIPVEFKPVLAAKAQVEVTLSIPLASMPENVQKIFLDKEASISSINGAKNVFFTNGKKIIVSK